MNTPNVQPQPVPVRRYELPKVMNVGEKYTTITAGRPYDLRILAVIYIASDGESIRIDSISTGKQIEVPDRTRTIVVWERHNPNRPSADAWQPFTALREEFLTIMERLKPVLYKEPNIRALIHYTIYCAENTPDTLFLSSEAYRLVKHGIDHHGAVCYRRETPTQLYYDDTLLLEVPGVDGIRVWGGTETNERQPTN